MTGRMQKLIKQAILKLACDGDSEAMLIALNLEDELENNQTFKEMLDA